MNKAVNELTAVPNRIYKARIFEMVFSDKKEFWQTLCRKTERRRNE